jgi:tetratricopeptide (TPR) repeat protein
METKNDIQSKFDDGRYALMNDNLSESIDCFSEVIQLDPGHHLARISRATAYLKLNKVSEAIMDFDRVIDLVPNYAKAYHLRGLAKEKSGDLDGGLADISRAIEIDPEYSAAFYSRATLLSGLKREEEAMEDIQMVQHLTNKNIETFANENNVWRSQHLRLEAAMESEMQR